MRVKHWVLRLMKNPFFYIGKGMNRIFFRLIVIAQALILIACKEAGMSGQIQDEKVLLTGDVAREIDVTDYFELKIIPVESAYPVNITKIRWTENGYLYLASDAKRKELYIYDMNNSDWLQPISFDELMISPVDFCVNYPNIYILDSKDEIKIYDLNQHKIINTIRLEPKKYSEIELTQDGYLLLKKDNLVGIESGISLFHRIEIFQVGPNFEKLEKVSFADPYVIQEGGNTLLSNGQSLLKQDHEVYWIKPFCDSIFYFDRSNQNFAFFKAVRFDKPVPYAAFSPIKNEYQKLTEIMSLQKYQTGIFFYRENHRFLIFQFLDGKDPAFYYRNKVNGKVFAAKKLNHKSAMGLPFPELITSSELVAVLNENNLLKNSFESTESESFNLKRSITYEGKNYLFIYRPYF